MLQLLIVDDNAQIRRGVAVLRSSKPEWKVCSEASNGEEALKQAREFLPNLVLLDVSLPGANGFEVAKVIRHEMPSTKIVMMSQHDSEQLLPRAIQAGADSCVDKDSLSTDLIPIIEGLITAQ
jgi:DNA-binding NarL/FixJ family response regulator